MLICLDDMEGFRRKILEAKRSLMGLGSASAAVPFDGTAGAGKSAPGMMHAADGFSIDPAAKATLDRMEALMREALDLMKSRGGAREEQPGAKR